MAEKKHALLIFTKPPLPGLVKTRMTTNYGGFLSEEQAAQFYKCCFFDVCNMAMEALVDLQEANDLAIAADPEADKITYDFFCSTTPAESVEKVRALFDEISPWPLEIHLLADKGKTFDEHFNDACQQLFDLGYESFVAIGGDVPTMPKNHIIQAFNWLDYFQSQGMPGFVQAPCQECGTSLVGYSYNTPIDHTGIYYNMDGRPALDGYVEKLQATGAPSAYFDPVADIDEVTDLAHSISCMKAIREAARFQPLFVPYRTLNWCEFMGLRVTTPPNDNHDPRDYLDGEGEEAAGAEAAGADAAGAADASDLVGATQSPAEEGASASDLVGATQSPATGDATANANANADALTEPTPEELQRIAKGMTAIMEERQKGFDYEREKYN